MIRSHLASVVVLLPFYPMPGRDKGGCDKGDILRLRQWTKIRSKKLIIHHKVECPLLPLHDNVSLQADSSFITQ